MMRETATIKFQDAVTRDEAVAIVRQDANTVALCLSLKSDGDVEVVMSKEDAHKLLDALKQAV
jgi:hypothetical protein